MQRASVKLRAWGVDSQPKYGKASSCGGDARAYALGQRLGNRILGAAAAALARGGTHCRTALELKTEAKATQKSDTALHKLGSEAYIPQRVKQL